MPRDRGRSRSKLGGDDEPRNLLAVYFSVLKHKISVAEALVIYCYNRGNYVTTKTGIKYMNLIYLIPEAVQGNQDAY